ncbi:hypothetical protein H5T87_01475 [bacterium]|nr:hypothetical protein [bacterium]
MKVCWLSVLIDATITLWDEKRNELFLSDVVATDWDDKFKSIFYSLLGISFIIAMLYSGLVLDIEIVYLS